MILRKNAVDVDAPLSDVDDIRRTGAGDIEGVGRGDWIDRTTHRIQRSGLNAACDFGEELVPIGVKLHASLGQDDRGVALEGIEGGAAVIEAHVIDSCSISGFVAGFCRVEQKGR